MLNKAGVEDVVRARHPASEARAGALAQRLKSRFMTRQTTHTTTLSGASSAGAFNFPPTPTAHTAGPDRKSTRMDPSHG